MSWGSQVGSCSNKKEGWDFVFRRSPLEGQTSVFVTEYSGPGWYWSRYSKLMNQEHQFQLVQDFKHRCDDLICKLAYLWFFHCPRKLTLYFKILVWIYLLLDICYFCLPRTRYHFSLAFFFTPSSLLKKYPSPPFRAYILKGMTTNLDPDMAVIQA